MRQTQGKRATIVSVNESKSTVCNLRINYFYNYRLFSPFLSSFVQQRMKIIYLLDNMSTIITSTAIFDYATPTSITKKRVLHYTWAIWKKIPKISRSGLYRKSFYTRVYMVLFPSWLSGQKVRLGQEGHLVIISIRGDSPSMCYRKEMPNDYTNINQPEKTEVVDGRSSMTEGWNVVAWFKRLMTPDNTSEIASKVC